MATNRRLRSFALVSAVLAGLAVATLGSAPALAAADGAGDSGQGRQGRIVGGVSASKDEFPFMVSIQTPRGEHFCGGSMMSADIVITAAHCIDGTKPSQLRVVVGRADVSNPHQGVQRSVVESLLHPRYHQDWGYDLGLLLLDRSVPGVLPVKLPAQGTDSLMRPGQSATVIGWGNTDTDLPFFPERLRKVEVPILSHDECALSNDGYNRAVSLCAGVEGKDSCQGDSGGLLIRTIAGRAYQIGVVSRGHGCAEQGAPGVYTSLSSAELWNTLWAAPNGARMKAAAGIR